MCICEKKRKTTNKLFVFEGGYAGGYAGGPAGGQWNGPYASGAPAGQYNGAYAGGPAGGQYGGYNGGYEGGYNGGGNPLDRGEYTGDGDYHGEGLEEAGAYGDVSQSKKKALR